MPSNHLILCCPLLLLPSVFPFPASGSFPMSQFFPSGGQSTGASVSASVLPINIQDWFPLGLTGLISLQSKELSRVFSNTTVQKQQFFGVQPVSTLIFIHDYWKNHSFDYTDFCQQSNASARLVIAFRPRNKHLLISRLQSPSAVVLEPKKRKSDTVSIVSPSICHGMMGWMPWS